MPQSELQVEALVAGYASAPPVLQSISFRVATGEVLAVLGRNGAGKTTLLRCISGLMRPRSGSIAIGSEHLESLPAHMVAARGVAHVPEGRRVIAGMTVLDNLRLGGYLIRRRTELERSLDEVMTLFPALKRWLGKRAGTLSGGQQQLLSIGRALMARPRVLLLDEPLTGLDPIFQREVVNALRDIRSGERAIVLVEQNARRSLDVADRGLVIDSGTVVLEGSADALRNDPRVQEGYLGISAGSQEGAAPPPTTNPIGGDS